MPAHAVRPPFHRRVIRCGTTGSPDAERDFDVTSVTCDTRMPGAAATSRHPVALWRKATRGQTTLDGSAGDGGLPARTAPLIGGDVTFVPQGEADVVEALEEAPAGVVVDLEARHDVAGGDGARHEVDGDRGAGVVLEQLP